MRLALYTIVLFKQFMIAAGSVATTGHDEMPDACLVRSCGLI